MTTTYANPHYLAEPEWLRAHLADDDLRIIDARFDVRPGSDGNLEEVSGRAEYSAGHLPGAQFVDLKSDLADLQNPTAIIGPEAFSELMNRLGIGTQSTVVLYDDRGGAWAARLWWALRYYGHEDVRILNGGLRAWRAAGGKMQVEVPTTTTTTPSSAQFVSSVRERLRVTKQGVLAAIDGTSVRIIDSLPAPFYQGQVRLYPRHRKGHIPGALNLPAELNLDLKTFRLKSMDELRDLWQAAAIAPGQPVITYCGGGIFASFALFVLALMGHENAALYDASWQEWGCDNNLPVEVDCPTTN